METLNHECYVSLEVAKLLKQARFDWKTEYAYVDELFCPMRSFSSNFNSWGIKIHEFVSAPTLDVAQRWLREVKGYYVAWEFNMNISPWGQELYDFTDISVYIFVDSEQGNICKCKLKENYKTIEEAQEAGIKKVVEMILEEEK